jgi:hypothetical protein
MTDIQSTPVDTTHFGKMMMIMMDSHLISCNQRSIAAHVLCEQPGNTSTVDITHVGILTNAGGDLQAAGAWLRRFANAVHNIGVNGSHERTTCTHDPTSGSNVGGSPYFV